MGLFSVAPPEPQANAFRFAIYRGVNVPFPKYSTIEDCRNRRAIAPTGGNPPLQERQGALT